MKSFKYIIIPTLLLLLLVPTAKAQIGMRELGDSLTVYTGFSSVWSPAVRVKKMRVNGNNVSIYTNITLSHYRWTPENLADVKRKVSKWVLGHGRGNVTIYSAQTDISTLVTDCAKGIYTPAYPNHVAPDLTERNIALWPSHGLYYNAARDGWIWQRATLWTTVEDLYSQEYVRLLRRMLENAGATVYMPRAGLEHSEPGVSGMPQWTEGARYWLISQGADSTIWDLYEGDEYKDDMKCRAMWVNSLDVPIDLCMAVHTDGQDSGNDSTIIGTLCIYTAADDEGNTTLRDGRDRERVNRNYADWIQTQLVEDLRHLAPEWTRRQLQEANYCESRVPVVPGLILEILSHKNMADMKYGLDPKFRFTASRAIYKGILKYLNGKAAVVQPLPVEQLGVRFSDASSGTNNAVLYWESHPDPLEPTATPTYYMVYTQANDGEWDVQQVENTTQLEVHLNEGTQYNFYVVAGNEGGLSFPSPMVSACKSERSGAPVALVIDAFDDVYGPEWFADSTFAGIVPGTYACEDRFSCAYIGKQWDYVRTHPWKNDDNCGWGSCYRDHAGTLTVGNTRDYTTSHGHVLRRMHVSYVSCTEGILQQQSTVSDYTLIDVICGRQRSPLRDHTKNVLADYIGHGGRVLISSDHVDAIDKAWLKRWLHASYYAPNATHNGRIITPKRRHYQMLLEPNEEQLFTCCPQGLKPEGDKAVRMAEYMDMRCGAAVGWTNEQMVDGKTVSTKTLLYGFPLEAVTEFDKIYRHSIQWLLDN